MRHLPLVLAALVLAGCGTQPLATQRDATAPTAQKAAEKHPKGSWWGTLGSRPLDIRANSSFVDMSYDGSNFNGSVMGSGVSGTVMPRNGKMASLMLSGFGSSLSGMVGGKSASISLFAGHMSGSVGATRLSAMTSNSWISGQVGNLPLSISGSAGGSGEINGVVAAIVAAAYLQDLVDEAR